MTIPHPRSDGRPYIPVATYTTACPNVKINANTIRQLEFRKRVSHIFERFGRVHDQISDRD